jgi:hypothetical protein
MLTRTVRHDRVSSPEDPMFNPDDEKGKLIEMLSEKYSRNIITMEEYERILEYINKIETEKEIRIIEKIILESASDAGALELNTKNEAAVYEAKEKHLSLFAWRTTNINPRDGNGGNFTTCFGANRIIVDDLPRGRTILKVNSIFGLTEIIVRQDVKIVNKAIPVFAGIFTPNETRGAEEDLPELCITGKAVFGSITVITVEELKEKIKKEKEFGEEYAEKIRQKMLDKMSGKR